MSRFRVKHRHPGWYAARDKQPVVCLAECHREVGLKCQSPPRNGTRFSVNDRARLEVRQIHKDVWARCFKLEKTLGCAPSFVLLVQTLLRSRIDDTDSRRLIVSVAYLEMLVRRIREIANTLSAGEKLRFHSLFLKTRCAGQRLSRPSMSPRCLSVISGGQQSHDATQTFPRCFIQRWFRAHQFADHLPRHHIQRAVWRKPHRQRYRALRTKTNALRRRFLSWPDSHSLREHVNRNGLVPSLNFPPAPQAAKWSHTFSLILDWYALLSPTPLKLHK